MAVGAEATPPSRPPQYRPGLLVLRVAAPPGPGGESGALRVADRGRTLQLGASRRVLVDHVARPGPGRGTAVAWAQPPSRCPDTGLQRTTRCGRTDGLRRRESARGPREG